MDINLHVWHHADPKLAAALAKIDHHLATLISQGKAMNAIVDNLAAKVAALETVEQSAIVLLQGLKAALDEALANGDLAAVQAIADRIGADTETLAAAVAANTPAAP